MPGFFSSNTANILIARSDHLLDWSRVGALIISGQHRYSWYELVQRGLVISSMTAGTYAGYHYSGKEALSLKVGLFSMAGCFSAFVLSHTLVIASLLYKRYHMKQQCIASEKTIVLLLNSLKEAIPENTRVESFIAQVISVVSAIMALNLSDDKHGRASQTWGARALLMDRIVAKIADDMACFKMSVDCDLLLSDRLAFWTQPPSALYRALREFAPITEESVSLSPNLCP